MRESRWGVGGASESREQGAKNKQSVYPASRREGGWRERVDALGGARGGVVAVVRGPRGPCVV